MANVLITTLQSSISNNDGYQKLNTIVLKTRYVDGATLARRTLYLRTNAAVSLSIKGGADAYFVDANGDSLGTSIELSTSPDSDVPVRWSNADATIVIENKNAITKFGNPSQSAYFTIDVEQFNYTGNLAYLVINRAVYNGLEKINLRNSPNLATILYDTRQEVDFDNFPTRSYSFFLYNITSSNGVNAEKLSKLTTVSTLSVTSSTVKLDAEDIFVGMLVNGRTANLAVADSTAIKLNNVVLNANIAVTFGTGTITVKQGGTTVATYSDGVWSYV